MLSPYLPKRYFLDSILTISRDFFMVQMKERHDYGTIKLLSFYCNLYHFIEENLDLLGTDVVPFLCTFRNHLIRHQLINLQHKLTNVLFHVVQS